MARNTILLIFSLFVFIHCTAQKNKKPTNSTVHKVENSKKTYSNSQLQEFGIGENRFLKEYGMNVTFSGIQEDSRCPKGTQCIWQGIAVVNVEFMGTYTRPMTIQMSTTQDANRGLSNVAFFNGYQITLKSVTPYPTSESSFETNKNKYKISLQFQKTDKNTSESTTSRGGVATQ